MPQVNLLRVVVASPGDVQAERDCVERVAAELNHGIADVLGLRLEVVRWETDAFPGFSPKGSQGQIDAALRIEASDLLVGVFWKKFGTPVSDAGSGTEHEIRSAYHSWRQTGHPQIMVYFNQQAPLNPTPEETLQWQQVRAFQRDKLFTEGLWWNYSGVAEFERLVRTHLTQYLRHRTTPAEMRVQTIETPLGLMDVSNNPANQAVPARQLTPALTEYRSPTFGFQICWPPQNWLPTDDPGSLQQLRQMVNLPPTVAFALFISYRQPILGFVPNVNVVVEQVGLMSLQQYMIASAQTMTLSGLQVVNSMIDEGSQSGFQVVVGHDPMGRQLYQFNRMVLSRGRSYVVTGSQLPPLNQFGLRLRDELATILNSFRLP